MLRQLVDEGHIRHDHLILLARTFRSRLKTIGRPDENTQLQAALESGMTRGIVRRIQGQHGRGDGYSVSEFWRRRLQTYVAAHESSR